METKNGVLTVMQGEQFSRLIRGIPYDGCDQIVLCLYREPERDNKTYFVKVADELYQDASLIWKSENSNYEIGIDISKELTDGLELGTYYIEAEITTMGTLTAAIVKISKPFFQLIKSEL